LPGHPVFIGGVSVRLLLDENLSERLLPLILDRFPDSSHVRMLGLGGADDLLIWERARTDGALLVTKDEDFLRLSVTRGFPPRVICLAIGNAGNAATAALLLDHAETIEAFSIHPEAGFLLLKPGGQAP
jgi:predicted nuclease of predicted toxin-antitoxin system